LPDEWLNDGAKAFVPSGATFERWRSLDHLETIGTMNALSAKLTDHRYASARSTIRARTKGSLMSQALNLDIQQSPHQG
jgi:hypothetical protein